MKKRPFSRRDFLKTAGITLGASALACSGLGYAASIPPEIETPELSYAKEQAMNKKILITYATRAGSTVEVAAAIGEALSQRGLAVDVKPVKEKPSLANYQAILMGSAIRMGSWLPEAVEFIKTNQPALNKMPVAIFTVHMNNTGEDDASRAARLAYLDAVRPLLNQAEEVYFAGKLDFASVSFLEQLVVKIVAKGVEADRRDWDKIHSWVPAILA
jgi:menaquinone-dependent protoporphyrinogen oxidase